MTSDRRNGKSVYALTLALSHFVGEGIAFTA